MDRAYMPAVVSVDYQGMNHPFCAWSFVVLGDRSRPVIPKEGNSIIPKNMRMTTSNGKTAALIRLTCVEDAQPILF
jgi:hypothetical protein